MNKKWMLAFVAIAAVIGLIITSVSSSIEGNYNGTCENINSGARTDLNIAINQYDDGEIYGFFYMGLGEFEGGGLIQGFVEDDKIYFESINDVKSSNDNNSYKMRWSGTIKTSHWIEGSYRAEANDDSIRPQEGTFHILKHF